MKKFLKWMEASALNRFWFNLIAVAIVALPSLLTWSPLTLLGWIAIILNLAVAVGNFILWWSYERRGSNS